MPLNAQANLDSVEDLHGGIFEVTSIWPRRRHGWSLLSSVGFPDEVELHTLVEKAPQVLPLAGSPQLTIVGEEVTLGTGSADLLAVESDGSLAIIEVKLERNPEARRSVVAQVLAYAGFLHGLEPSFLEGQILARHLRLRGFESLFDAAIASDQQVEALTFAEGLTRSLADGRFRLVLVLDAAPRELVQVVQYLATLTDKIVIDLVTVAQFQVGSSRIIVPQRVEPERSSIPSPSATGAVLAKPKGSSSPGSQEFESGIADASKEQSEFLRLEVDWAKSLEDAGLANLWSYQGPTGIKTLLVYLVDEQVSLVTLYKDGRSAYLSGYRSVFERRAPLSLAALDELMAPNKIGRATTIRPVNQDVLSGLAQAYRKAAS